MKNNFILMTDSYKLSHWKQLPTNTTLVDSYMESRINAKFNITLFCELQYYLYKYLQGNVVNMDDLEEANEFSLAHFGSDMFNYEGWKYIIETYQGKLPIRIKAPKEGTIIPIGNVLMTIENTDPKCAWLTNVVETLLMKLWYPITVATNGFECKLAILKMLRDTGCDEGGLLFKLHDFGYRGVSSEETAEIGGAAHLINFMGTDNLAAIQHIRQWYDKDYFEKGKTKAMYGFSVPASEHSVALMWGEGNEEGYFLNMLEQYPTGIVSIVIDTYDAINFVETMSTKYKDKILDREGVVVFRPDSGNPVEINMKLINILWKHFGGTYTSKGYKLLDNHVRLIQGDGIDKDMIIDILNTGAACGYAADNWVFGSGGGLLQKWNRDDQRFAIKPSYGEKLVDGNVVGFDLSKKPKTDLTKSSKPGKLKLHKSGEFGYSTLSSFNYSNPAAFNGYVDELEVVFENGVVKRFQTFENIRDIANKFIEHYL